MKYMIIPLITGATGILTNLKKKLEVTPGKHSMDSLQRQLYMESHTQYGKYSSLTLEALAVGIT
jgi:hypothetical protein